MSTGENKMNHRSINYSLPWETEFLFGIKHGQHPKSWDNHSEVSIVLCKYVLGWQLGMVMINPSSSSRGIHLISLLPPCFFSQLWHVALWHFLYAIVDSCAPFKIYLIRDFLGKSFHNMFIIPLPAPSRSFSVTWNIFLIPSNMLS